MNQDAAQRRQNGSASILVVMLGLCILSVAMVACLIATAVQARHQAQTGADAAALAAAMRVAQGPGAACDRADELATDNHAAVTDCSVTGGYVTIEVAVAPALLEPVTKATARSRAGPVPGQGLGTRNDMQRDTEAPIKAE